MLQGQTRSRRRRALAVACALVDGARACGLRWQRLRLRRHTGAPPLTVPTTGSATPPTATTTTTNTSTSSTSSTTAFELGLQLELGRQLGLQLGLELRLEQRHQHQHGRRSDGPGWHHDSTRRDGATGRLVRGRRRHGDDDARRRRRPTADPGSDHRTSPRLAEWTPLRSVCSCSSPQRSSRPVWPHEPTRKARQRIRRAQRHGRRAATRRPRVTQRISRTCSL